MTDKELDKVLKEFERELKNRKPIDPPKPTKEQLEREARELERELAEMFGRRVR